MKKYFLLLLIAPLLFLACEKEDLPPTEFVMVKFENKTGKNMENLTISKASIGNLGSGDKTDYIQYEALGRQGLVDFAAHDGVEQVIGVS